MRSCLPAGWQVSSPADCWCPSPARPCHPSPFSRRPGSASSLWIPSSPYPDSSCPLPLAWPDLDSSSVCLSLSPHHPSHVWRCAAVPGAVVSACWFKQNRMLDNLFFTALKTVFRIRIHLIRIRIQHFKLNTDPDLIRTQCFDDQKLKKITGRKKNIFLIKNCNLPIPRPRQRWSRLQKTPFALQREHPALHNIKFLNFPYFCGSFFPPGSESGL